jgi:phospholipase/carboxylesterase
MVMTLSGPSQPPAAGGKPKKLVLLLHGLGSDGNDLIGLAPYWGRLLPTAEFVAPNAPFPCDMGPFGYQWFSLQDRSMEVMLAGMRAATPILEGFIDDLLTARGLDERDLALVGFSQGTMMSLHVGLRRPAPVAGILGYSGALLGAEILPQEIRSRPPTLLVHGDADEVVPFSALTAAQKGLTAAGVPVETLVCPGLGHAIDEAGLKKGGEFLRRVLAG